MAAFLNFPLSGLLVLYCLASSAYSLSVLGAEELIRDIDVEWIPGREPTEEEYLKSQVEAAISMKIIKEPEVLQMAATRMGIHYLGIPAEDINLRNITSRQSRFEAAPILVSGTASSILLRFNIESAPITAELRDVMTRAAGVYSVA